MDNLERLASSIAQIEVLVGSLKRENRDLATRLGQAASERRQLELAAEARLRDLQAQLTEAQSVLKHDPGLEARAQAAELEAADLARQVDQARREHFEEKGRLEALIRQLESQVLAKGAEEQLPTASPQALEEAQNALKALQAEKEAAEGRAARLELDLGILHGQLEQAQEREAQARQGAEALRARQGELEKRVTALESSGLDLERQLADAQRRLAGAPDSAQVQAWQARLAELEALAQQAARLDEQAQRQQEEQAALKKQKRELAGLAKERALLRRKVEELVATLESVRLG
jgi:chromosome segregation ATPase